MLYHNNGFRSYVDLVYDEYNFKKTNHFLLKVIKISPVIVWRTIQDAAIELIFLLIFWIILVKMSQGRDLVVSLFEPNGLYGKTRIVFTTLAILSFSVSMWIIPAFIFHRCELKTSNDPRPQQPFQKHLFFMHRVLPLIPFWVLASVLFNGHAWVFVLAGITELVLLYYFNHWVGSHAARAWVFGGIGLLLILLSIYFFFNFQQQYTEMKVVLAINLYLLSVLVFFVYHEVDRRILREHELGYKEGQSLHAKYKINTIVYLTCLAVHSILVLLIYFLPFNLAIAPESMLLYMFSVYVFAIDLIVYMINITRKRRMIAAIALIALIALIASPLWKINVSHYTMDKNADSTVLCEGPRDDFDKRYSALRNAILANTSDEPYPIILISGEGGGSRAGLWFSQNLINFDYETSGKFRNHIFSVSTVSGSSVGLGTVLTFWDKTRNARSIDSAWLNFPAEVYANNYVGSSIRGLLLTDLYKSLVPGNWSNDRNTTLQNEEASTTARAVLKISGDAECDSRFIPDSAMTLKKDFMYFFYEKRDGKVQYRNNTPIALINTCRSNDGRRGIFSSIRLSDSYFNEALDIAGYMYEDSICNDKGVKTCMGNKMPISLGQACNTSELFPVFSAPAYIDSLGSFVDGGYHENSGLKSTLDIYQQLRIRLDHDGDLLKGKYKIYILYLKNGSGEKQLYKKHISEPTLLQPLNALFNQPFEGSASYFEEKAKFVSAPDSNAVFVPVNLRPRYLVNPDIEGVKDKRKKALEAEILKDLINEVVVNPNGTRDTILNFPLARWLSRTVINRIQMCAAPANRGSDVTELLEKVKMVNRTAAPSNKPFNRFPVHKELKVASEKTDSARYQYGSKYF